MTHNAAVIKLVSGRYSAHIRSFNFLPVSEEDSDTQFWLNKELADIATAVFGRIEEFKPSGNRRALLASTDLGNAYRALRQGMTGAEKERYEEIQEALISLSEKYES